MSNVTCPNCQEEFKLNDLNSSLIIKQVRDKQFNDEVNERLKELSSKINADHDLEIIKLKANLDRKDQEKLQSEAQLKDKFNQEIASKNDTIRLREEQVQFYKDMKMKLSTKMLGETLEQHCEAEFNKLRATAFQNAYFEKDNDSSGGSKGDFIFKENDDDGTEIISIMFEMKNEGDETATKKKNEEFFQKLDADRKAKNCEYAVLVSLLESDNEYYNSGIADVSHKYNKMYVIRPQFFISIISILRNASLNSLQYKKQIAEFNQENIDVTNFENELNAFKENFQNNYDKALKYFMKAIEEIDKSIKRMEAVKSALITSSNQLRIANNKATDLTIKKLTKNNPTMKNKFEKLK